MCESLRTVKNIYIPIQIVNKMLDCLGYRTILDFYNKHILDIAAGNGNFLIEIVSRTIIELTKFKKNKEFIKQYLEKYIHAIECNIEYKDQLKNILDVTSGRFGIFNVKWDIQENNAIENNSFIGMMDYVVGNIFYTSIKDLKIVAHQYQTLINKQTNKYTIHNSKAQEFYFEFGINCLKFNSGKLCFLSSNTWLRSENLKNFRRYLNENVKIDFVINFNFHSIFEQLNINPAITLITRQNTNERSILLFEYSFNGIWNNDVVHLIEPTSEIKLPLSGNNAEIESVIETLTLKENPYIQNLSDFIIDNNKYLNEWKDWTIDIYKTNKNTWSKLIYPYDKNCQLKPSSEMPESLKQYLLKLKPDFEFDNIQQWYGFDNPNFFKNLSKKRFVFNKNYHPQKEVYVHLIEPYQAVLDGILLFDYNYSTNEINLALKSEYFLNWIQCFGKTSYGDQYKLTVGILSKYLSWWFTQKNV